MSSFTLQKLTNLMEYTITPAILEDLDIDFEDKKGAVEAFKVLQGLIAQQVEALEIDIEEESK